MGRLLHKTYLSTFYCVTESHLDTNIVDNDIIIDGFSDQILRKDRNCFGGVVLVYTSQDICVKTRYDLNFASGVNKVFLYLLKLHHDHLYLADTDYFRVYDNI
jgi:hypothetical protein